MKGRWAALDKTKVAEKNTADARATKNCSHDDFLEWRVPVKCVKGKKKTTDAQTTDESNLDSFAGLMEEECDVPICPVREGWERLAVVVDSGAAETMCPASMAANVAVALGDEIKAGVRYTCAGWRNISNLGEKRCLLGTNDSETVRGLTMHVA